MSDEETIKACHEAYEKLNLDEVPLWVFTAHGWFNMDDETELAEFRRLHPGYVAAIDPTSAPGFSTYHEPYKVPE